MPTTAPSQNRKSRWRWAVLLMVTLAIVLTVFIVGPWSFDSRAARLRVGMTQKEVFELMGEPQYTFSVGASATRFCVVYAPLSFDVYQFLIIPTRLIGDTTSVALVEFPAYVEFEGDTVIRVRRQGVEVESELPAQD